MAVAFKRAQRISNALQLAQAGFVEHAVKQYLAGDAPDLAAELLASRGRVGDALQLLSRYPGRPQEIAAAALRARGRSEREVSTLLSSLGDLSDDERDRFAQLAGLPALRASSGAAPIVRGWPDSEPPRDAEAGPADARDPAALDPAARDPDALDPEAQATLAVARARRAASRFDPASVDGVPLDGGAPIQAAEPAAIRSSESPVAESAVVDTELRSDELQDLEIDIEVEVDDPAPVGLRRPAAPPPLPSRARPSTPASPPPLGAKSSGVYDRVEGPGEAAEARIEASIRQLVASGRKDAAARVAQAAGRHHRAAAWFEEVGDHLGAGESLYAIGWYAEAIASLMQVKPRHRDFRVACRLLARSAAGLGTLDPRVAARLSAYIESGPRSDQELSSFLDLAELLWADGDRRRAYRCLHGVLQLDPGNTPAELMQLTWAAEAERDGRA